MKKSISTVLGKAQIEESKGGQAMIVAGQTQTDIGEVVAAGIELFFKTLPADKTKTVNLQEHVDKLIKAYEGTYNITAPAIEVGEDND